MLELLIFALVLASGLTGWMLGQIIRECSRPAPIYWPVHRHFLVVKGGKKS